MRDQNHSTMCSFVFLPEEKKTHEKIPSFLIIKKKLIKITQNLFHQARRIILINSYSYVSIQCFINRVKYTQSSNKTTKSPIQQTYCYELRWIQQYQEWNYREIWKEKKKQFTRRSKYCDIILLVLPTNKNRFERKGERVIVGFVCVYVNV